MQIQNRKWRFAVPFMAAFAVVAVMAACSADTAVAPSDPMFAHLGGTSVAYTGQGWTNGALNNELCTNLANDGGTGQGVSIEDGYLLWILTANGAQSAKLSGPWTGDVPMVKVGGTFKLATDYYDLAELSAVHATYVGNARGNVQLTVSHGCRGITTTGAFCSPGFWRNNEAAWNVLVDEFSAPTASLGDLFGNTVQPFALTPAVLNALSGTTLETVLAAPPIQSPVTTYNFGGGAAFNTNLGPFNAVGAYLTTLIPLPGGSGYYTFDPAQVGTTDHFCPLNADGSYKEVVD